MSTSLDGKLCDSMWSEEYDCVPLSLRSKMLRVKLLKQNHVEAGVAVLDADDKLMRNDISVDRMEKIDHNDKGIQIVKQSATTVFATSSVFHNNHGSDSAECFGKSDIEKNSRVSAMCTATVLTSEVFGDEKASNVVDAFVHEAASEVADFVSKHHSVHPGSILVEASNFKGETIYEFDADLDNIVLAERRRMLISSRRLVQSSGSYIASRFEERSKSSEASQIDQVSNFLSSANDPLDSKCQVDETSHGNSTTHDHRLTLSVLSSLANVKMEPVDETELCNQSKSDMQNVLVSSETLCVKSEPLCFDYARDDLDLLPLSYRIKMLLTGAQKRGIDMRDNLDSSKESFVVGTNFLESGQSISISRPLKRRRRTATNSVETALEEDAPELLKVLVERGISVDEMKLYGEEDSDGELDDSLCEDGFAELEAVISQLFTQRESFLKFPLLRTKGAKVSYCLACLLSLVEQTKFLQNRKWPVEWGWCRDLQSFIFVFHRHNRIVLERPEYGYATYFFELLNSVPATWQIKRLVTALKLTSCGRITLMENKPLVVGEDLSEVEAKVLADYGWTPNTGLGTMLNYCDRVFHDRKQEMDSSEWRSKIGKQLLNGYNGGNIVSENLVNRLNEDPCLQQDEDVQVKLEQ